MPATSFLALDCGGTKCRARLEADDGAVLAEPVGGPANWAATPRNELITNLTQVLSGIDEVGTGVICMAGILTAQDKLDAEALLASIVPGRWHAFPDTLSSLAACNDPNAVCVISGTGSGVCSFDSANQMVKSGGGGPMISDCGSGFFAGRTALARFLVAGAELPHLFDKLDATYGPGGVSTWLAEIYRRPSPQAEIAQVGSWVAALATDGNEPCQSILGEAMQPLADLTLEHMRNQGFPERQFKVFLSGGFWEASHYVPKIFGIYLRMPTYCPPLTPIEGAMKIARSIHRK
ncbi:MAG: hypothetical protein JNK63_03765 [Chthonomonas sp.]|nr:hypothetical protein [Chthonomonas sp.]